MRLRSILAFLLACVLLCGASARDSRPVAVWFYADWCMNCKLIKDKLAVMQTEYGAKVQFVKVDGTTPANQPANEKLAREFGFYDLFMTNNKTGWVALLDRNGKQIGELKQEMTPAQMRERLDQLVAAVKP
jgi:thiol:disulfide interchange protein